MANTPNPACLPPGPLPNIPSPSGSAAAAAPTRDPELGGGLCDILAGVVVGYAWPEFVYNDTGAIVTRRLINPTTGATYTPQGVMQRCPDAAGDQHTTARICGSISGGAPVQLDAHYLWTAAANPASVAFTLPGSSVIVPVATVTVVNDSRCRPQNYMPVCVERQTGALPTDTENQTLWAFAAPGLATVYYDPTTSPLAVVPTAQIIRVIDEGHCGCGNDVQPACVDIGTDIHNVFVSYDDAGAPSFFDYDAAGNLLGVTITTFRHIGPCDCERDS